MKRLPSLLLCFSLLACGGMEGPPGPAGPPGPSGEDGAGLLAMWACTGLGTDSGQQIALNSARYEFADGSVLATCILNDPSTSYSGTFLFKKGMPGAEKGSCLVVYDLDTPSEGYWDFATLKDSTATVTYTDPKSPQHGHKFPLKCTKR